MAEGPATTAPTEGPEWSARADGWAELWAGLAGPARVAIAGRRLPGADVRVGPAEALPWPDDTFDLVTGFNVFQFAADFVAALAETRRVTRPGGQVVVCNWARPEDRDLLAVTDPLRALGGDDTLAPRCRPDGDAEARAVILEAAAPFRRDDGGYRFENRFRYVVARA